MDRRTLVLADLHLMRDTPAPVGADLARLVDQAGDARLIFAGDLFDLSAVPAARRPVRAAIAGNPAGSAIDDGIARALDEALGAHPAARGALARHVDRGGEIWIASGNHDPEVASPDFDATLARALGASAAARARIRTSPWFFRSGALHVEHGHVYDPDNAPAHPLAVGGASLGVHFVEEFVAPTGAHAYLNANDETPLRLFLNAFRWYGARGPYVVYRFFHAAASGIGKSGPFFREGAQRTLGDAKKADFAAEARVSPGLVDALVARAARPTLASTPRTVLRMYLDRVAATFAISGGAIATATGLGAHGSPALLHAGETAIAAGAAMMAASWAYGHDRYTGTVTERLAAAAADVARSTDARLVVFGHTHREAEIGPYANTGSFAFPRGAPGRPYLEIEGGDAAPRAVRRHLARIG